MDYEETGTGFAPGTGVLIETDTTVMAGMVLNINELGVRLRTTHKLEVVGTITPEATDMYREVFDGLTDRELRSLVRSTGFGFVNSFRANRAGMLNWLTDQAVDDYNEKNAKKGLRLLSAPIETWIPMERVAQIESIEDFVNDTELKDYDFPTPEIASDDHGA